MAALAHGSLDGWLAGVGPSQLRDNLPAGCVGPGLFRAPWKRARSDDVVAEERGIGGFQRAVDALVAVGVFVIR